MADATADSAPALDELQLDGLAHGGSAAIEVRWWSRISWGVDLQVSQEYNVSCHRK